jgi:polar amino acid transport system permease protein
MTDKALEAWPVDGPLIVIPAQRTGRWAAMAIVTLIGLGLLYTIASNPRFDWPAVAQYLFNGVILLGLLNTVWLTVVTMALGVMLGVALAALRLSETPALSAPATLFVWFFRGTPALVQLIFWYNLAALYPTYSFGIPLIAPRLVAGSVNDLITPFTAAILGLALNEGAYMAEIVRAGILSVDSGQMDAGRALGMSRGKVMRRIILPQALRFIVPPTGNETIGMLKTTAIVSVIALSDLLYSAQTIYTRTFQTIPLLLVASLWYLALTSLLSLGQWRVERRLGRSQRGGR